MPQKRHVRWGVESRTGCAGQRTCPSHGVYVLHSPLDSYLLVLQKPCQSQWIGVVHPSKCLIFSPLLSRCVDQTPLPRSSMEYHPPETQVPEEKFGLQNVGQEELSGCVEETALGLGAAGHWKGICTSENRWWVPSSCSPHTRFFTGARYL